MKGVRIIYMYTQFQDFSQISTFHIFPFLQISYAYVPRLCITSGTIVGFLFIYILRTKNILNESMKLIGLPPYVQASRNLRLVLTSSIWKAQRALSCSLRVAV